MPVGFPAKNILYVNDNAIFHAFWITIEDFDRNDRYNITVYIDGSDSLTKIFEDTVLGDDTDCDGISHLHMGLPLTAQKGSLEIDYVGYKLGFYLPQSDNSQTPPDGINENYWTLDCNINKILDECDINSGTSKDRNRNYIPDECEVPNRPPQITHTPITSALQGKEILFSMEVTDDKNQLKTLVIYAKVAGEVNFTPYLIVISPGQTKYDMGISGLTETLDGVEYYIEATDAQGLAGYHRSDDGAHFICVTDPDKKTPVIIIPGIMGSELRDADTNDLIWLDKKILESNDPWLLKLLLQADGITPDQNHRCANNFNKICQAGTPCDIIWQCVPGGRPIKVTDVLSFDIANFGVYDAYDNLANFLVQNGYEDKVFGLAYDWRMDIEKIADDLNTAIKNSFAPNTCEKVEIIAHSMGGLVIRAYLKKYGDDHRVDNVIFLGTPHLGVPTTFAILEGYKPLLTWFREAFPKSLLDFNMWLELNAQTFVSQNFSTSYQLLPRFDFIFKKESNSWEAYTESYRLLENNSPALLNSAKEKFFPLIQGAYPADIHYYSLLGTRQLCLAGFVFKKDKCIAPLVDFYSDGTVPTLSATSFGQDKYWFAEEDHISLPENSATQEKILAILNGEPDTVIEGISDKPSELPDKDKKVWKETACCPVSLLTTDALGNMTGVDGNGVIREEIPGSEYFRFPENESIVTPYEGEYTLTVRGKDVGEFTLYVEAVNDENETLADITYRDIPVTDSSIGTIELTPDVQAPILRYDVDGNGSSDFELLPQQEIPEELNNLFTKRGDANYDHRLDMSDAITILSFLFSGTSKIACENAGDSNNDTTTDISDAVYILSFLFLGGENPSGIVFCSFSP